MLPERFGAYQVVRELGQGGMGRVYLARDPALGREVAIKTLAPGRAARAPRLRLRAPGRPGRVRGRSLQPDRGRAELDPASGDVVLIDGTADAARFGRGWLEIGGGQRPDQAARELGVGRPITVRLTVDNAAGRQRTDLLRFQAPAHR